MKAKKAAMIPLDLQVDFVFQLHQTGWFHGQAAGHSANFQEAEDHIARFPVQHWTGKKRQSAAVAADNKSPSCHLSSLLKSSWPAELEPEIGHHAPNPSIASAFHGARRPRTACYFGLVTFINKSNFHFTLGAGALNVLLANLP